MSININWLGLSCFKINAKFGDKEVDLVTDPYSPASGLKLPRNLAADIVTVSHDHPNHNYLDGVGGDAKRPQSHAERGGSPFVMKSPGEVEEKGIFVYGIRSVAHEEDALRPQNHAERGGKEISNTLYRFEIGDISIAHLGDIGHDFTDEELEELKDVDILFLPVGAKIKEAVKIANELQPRIIIPMHYRLPEQKGDFLPLEKFLKEIGAKSETMPKLRIAKKDLPQDEMKVIVLERGW